MKSLDDINADLLNQERAILPKSQEIDELAVDVDHMLEKDKGRKIDQA